MKTFRITEIVGWYRDEGLLAGDTSHEGYDAVKDLLDAEVRTKDYFEDYHPGIIPFTCEAETIDDAIDQLNEKHFKYDYLKVQDVDYEIV